MYKANELGEVKKELLEDPDLFFEMERKFNLFSLRTGNDIPLWDIFRSEVWNFIIYKEDIKSKAAVVADGKVKVLYKTAKRFAGLFKILKRRNYFFFGVSRFVNSSNQYYDPYLESIRSVIGSDFLLYETVLNKKNYKEAGVFDVSSYLQKLLKPFYLRKALKDLDQNSVEQIKHALYTTYGYEVVGGDVLRNIFFKFKVHYLFYKSIFSLNRFKAVFLHQNGFQKGLIYAAQKSNIPVFEFQHADVIEFNVVWHYGTLPNDLSDIIFPDAFLTYSDFWSLHNNIPAECVEIGTAIHNIDNVEVKSNSIAIISTKEHEDELNGLTLRLAALNADILFQYKLHPAQYHAIQEYIDLFSGYTNVEVVSVDKTISDLIKTTQSFIVIYSSVIFELLQAKKQVYIYERQNSWFFRKFYGLANVNLFNSAEKFYDQYVNNVSVENNSEPKLDFYKPLKLEKVESLLVQYNAKQ